MSDRADECCSMQRARLSTSGCNGGMMTSSDCDVIAGNHTWRHRCTSSRGQRFN